MIMGSPEDEALRLIATQVADRLGEAGCAFVEDDCIGALAETLHAFFTEARIRILPLPREPERDQPTRPRQGGTQAMDDRLADAIKRMGQMLRGTDDALGHLNCAEFQPIAEVLVLAGCIEAARGAILSHSAGDSDIWDHHHALYKMEDSSGEGSLLAGFIREIQTGEPIKKWRNVFGEHPYAEDYFTKFERDAHAKPLATAYQRDVLSFRWDAEHPQDDSSQGWALEVVATERGWTKSDPSR